ncbi:MAG TPA: alpha-glucuronidase family glycosyl hydrolase, partial [Chitinophagaceae bacterium]|nr:alpha-glucuronidase family glycosyl hydrolase [Chitinophagaceae bacterium]
MKKNLLTILLLAAAFFTRAEDGYRLWLRYDKITNASLLTQYNSLVRSFCVTGNAPILLSAKQELETGLNGLLGKKIVSANIDKASILAGRLVDIPDSYKKNRSFFSTAEAGSYMIHTQSFAGTTRIVIAGVDDNGVLYGIFHFLRLLQTQQSISHLNIFSSPKIKLRLLDHWDNLNRTVERGYAGFSLWNWHTLPGYKDKRYTDYARANASVGINGTVLTNVNANATVLTTPYLKKAAVLADIFRNYGIKVYLTARFSAPVEIGGLKTADPLDPSVQQWWKDKAKEIYSLIPDFGGFLVKANSEGQPGPQNYGRNHADGANMLADAVAPYKGIVMWRAFVYTNESPEDRHKQAYTEFVPLDGKFRSNVLVQVKNGAIDFQPREPFHPLFGAMPKTPLMMEFQLTQEYLGQATNLVYLAPMFKECLDSDTYSNGKGSTVAKIIDGSVDQHALNGIAGVANTGTDINWCGHPFAQSNWYAFGRLAWDYSLTSEQIADEWLRMTFSNDSRFLSVAGKMMLRSREIAVEYMTPMGLHHLMGTGHHYGPAPWVDNLQRADWNPVYYHKADSNGIGFDRTATGSNALGQYKPEARRQWEDPKTMDQRYLLWFHHLPWTWTTQSGRSVWDELCYQYNKGVDSVRWMQQSWQSLQGKIDEERFTQ